jgi:hypothetical protein
MILLALTEPKLPNCLCHSVERGHDDAEYMWLRVNFDELMIARRLGELLDANETGRREL